MLCKKTLFGLVLLFPSLAQAKVEAFFTPSLDCENKIIELIDTSEKIDIVVYAINNKQIVEALKRAKDRDAEIKILTDRLQASNKSSAVHELKRYGLNIKVHSKHKIEHNKFAVFDNNQVITGSYNWTNPASEKNSENCIIISDEEENSAQYQSRFNYLWNINSKEKSLVWFKRF